MTDRTENTTQKNNELNKRHKILNSVLCLLAIWLMALIFGDSLLYAVKPVIPTANRHQKGKIFLEYADSLSLNEMHPEYQVLSTNFFSLLVSTTSYRNSESFVSGAYCP